MRPAQEAYVRHYAKVEHEEVSGQRFHTHPYEYGRTGGGHNNVVRGGRNAHAQNDTGYHGEQHGDYHVSAGEAHDKGDKRGAYSCGGNDAGNDTGDGAAIPTVSVLFRRFPASSRP